MGNEISNAINSHSYRALKTAFAAADTNKDNALSLEESGLFDRERGKYDANNNNKFELEELLPAIYPFCRPAEKKPPVNQEYTNFYGILCILNNDNLQLFHDDGEELRQFGQFVQEKYGLATAIAMTGLIASGVTEITDLLDYAQKLDALYLEMNRRVAIGSGSDYEKAMAIHRWLYTRHRERYDGDNKTYRLDAVIDNELNPNPAQKVGNCTGLTKLDNYLFNRVGIYAQTTTISQGGYHTFSLIRTGEASFPLESTQASGQSWYSRENYLTTTDFTGLAADVYSWHGGLENIKRALQLLPELSWAHTNYAEMLLKQDQLDAAFYEINKALALDNGDPRAYFIRGKLYLALQDAETALVDFEKATSTTSDKVEPATCYYYAGKILFEEGDYNGSEEKLEQYIEEGTDDFLKADAHFYLGLIYQKQGEEKAREAKGEFDKAIALNPNHVEAHYQRAIEQSSSILFNAQQTIEDLDKVLQQKPDRAEAYYYRGRAYLKASAIKDRVDKAITDFEQAVRLSPQWEAPKLQLAYIRLNLKFYDNAHEDVAAGKKLLGQVLEINPSHAEANYELGMMALAEKQYAEAARYLSIVLENSGQNDYFQRERLDYDFVTSSDQPVKEPLSEVYFRRGLAYFKIGEVFAAEHDFDAAIAQNCSYIETAIYLRGLSRLKLGRYTEASQDIENADVNSRIGSFYLSMPLGIPTSFDLSCDRAGYYVTLEQDFNLALADLGRYYYADAIIKLEQTRKRLSSEAYALYSDDFSITFGLVSLQKGELEEAVIALGKGIDGMEDYWSSDKIFSTGYALRGLAYSLQKEKRAAMRDWEMAVSLNSQDGVAHNWLAQAYLSEGLIYEAFYHQEIAEQTYAMAKTRYYYSLELPEVEL